MTDTYYQSPQILGSAGLAIVSGDVWFQAWGEPDKLRAECNDTRPACHRNNLIKDIDKTISILVNLPFPCYTKNSSIRRLSTYKQTHCIGG